MYLRLQNFVYKIFWSCYKNSWLYDFFYFKSQLAKW